MVLNDELAGLFERYRRDGDLEAFATLYDRTATRLACIAGRLAGRRADVEDLLQTTYLLAIRARNRFDTDRPLLPWLITIMARAAKDQQRRAMPEPSAEVEPQDLREDARAAAEINEVEEALRAAVLRLSERLRDVVQLRVLQHCSIEQIATALRRPLTTVRKQLTRGLRELRSLLPAGFASGLALMSSAGAWGQLRSRVLAAADGSAVAVPVATASLRRLLSSLRLPAYTAAAAMVAMTAIVLWQGSLGEEAANPRAPASEQQRPASAGLPGTDRAAVPTLAASPAPAGTASASALHTVRVRVLLTDGSPVPSVPVFFGVVPSRPGESSVLVEMYDRGNVHAAMTDDEGRCALPSVPPGKVGINVGEPKFRNYVDANQPDETVLHVARVLEVAGRVVDNSGAGVAGALVLVSPMARLVPGLVVAETASGGSYSFVFASGQPCEVWATAPGWAPGRLQRVQQRDGRVRRDLELTTRGRTLRGRVVGLDQTGRGPARLSVATLGDHANDSPCVEAWSSADGSFVIDDVYPGRVLLMARMPDTAPGSIVVDGHEEVVEVVIGGTGIVRGQVVDTLDLHRRLFVVPRPYRSGRERRYGDRVRGATAELGADGKFEFRGQPAGDMLLRVETQDATLVHAERFSLAPGGVHDCTVSLSAEGCVAGVVHRQDGTPVRAGELVFVGDEGRSHLAYTGADGHFAVHGLRQAHYRVFVFGRQLEDGYAERVLATGTVGIDLQTTPRTASIRARLVSADGAPVTGAALSLHLDQLDASMFVGAVDESGCARFVGVLPTTQHVGIVRPDQARQPIGAMTFRPDSELDMGTIVLERAGGISVGFDRSDAAARMTHVSVRSALGPIDGSLIRNGNTLRSQAPLAPGTYVISLAGKGLAPIRRECVVHPGATTELQVTTEPAPTAHIEISFDQSWSISPVGHANVWITEVSNTQEVFRRRLAITDDPLTLEVGLAPGSYRVHAVGDWDVAGQTMFTVTAGEGLVRVTLDAK